MRKELQKMKDERATFTATFVRTGVKRDYGRDKPTILFNDVCDSTGKQVTDHIWFDLSQGFAALNLQEGDRIRFDARVKKYKKGYQGNRIDVMQSIEYDYKLSYPTRQEKLTDVDKA